MTNTGGARAPSGPAARHGAQRVQRFYNKASGKMETKQAMHAFQRPQQHPVPAGHKVSNTTHTTKTETVHTPGHPNPAAIPLSQMTPEQILARAGKIVDAEVASERLPYQEREKSYGSQLAGSLSAGDQAYGKLDSQVAGMQAGQADSAKTYQNSAADLLTKVSAPPTVAPVSDQAKQQQMNSQGLLQSIAAGAQAGTIQRQQAETNFLASLRAADAEHAVGNAENLRGDYSRKKGENTAEENKVLSSSTGRKAKLGLELESEAEKIKTAQAALQLNAFKANTQAANTRSEITTRTAGTRNAAAKLRNETKKTNADIAFKKADAPHKRRKEELDEKKKEIEITNALNKHPGAKHLTTSETNTYVGEAKTVFSKYKRMRAENVSPADARKALLQGYVVRLKLDKDGEPITGKDGSYVTQKEPLGGEGIKNAVWIDMAEQITQKRYIGAETKKALREMGLPDSQWSQKFLGKDPNQNRYGATGVKGKAKTK